MLRIEEGFDPTLYASDNSDLQGYVNHHRLLVPSIAAYDIHSREAKNATLAERYTKVVNGLHRSATLCFELDDLQYAAETDEWKSTKSFAGITKDTAGTWRYKRDPNSDHSIFSNYTIWTAKRNLIDVNDDVSIRERYTFATPAQAAENDIQYVIERGEADMDIVIATATVYALNTKIKKPRADRFIPKPSDTDWSNYPEILKTMRNSGS